MGSISMDKLKEVKARLNFEGCSERNSKIQEVSQYSESRTPNIRGEPGRRRRSRRSRSMSKSREPTPSVFSKIRCDRSESPRHGLRGEGRKEKGIFNRLGGKGRSVFAHSESRHHSSRSRKMEPIPKKCYHKGTSSRGAEAFSGVKTAMEDTKNRVEIHHIKQREGESIEDFVQRFKTESRNVKGFPKCLRISGFMHGITSPELIKRLHDKIPKSMDEMMKTTTTFLRGRVARKRVTQSFSPDLEISFPPLGDEDGAEGPMIIESEIGGDMEHSTSAWMNFVVVRSPSPYKEIIGRPGVRKIQAHPTTGHEMLKFLVPGGILTLQRHKIIPLECTMVLGPESDRRKEAKHQKLTSRSQNHRANGDKKNLQAHVDSRLVANQVNGSYVAKEPGMIQYPEKVKTLTSSFKKFSIKQVSRSENKKADALTKIASTSFAHLTKQVLVEVLKEKYINEAEVLVVVKVGRSTWMTPIYEYLTEETLPAKNKKARAVRCNQWNPIQEILSWAMATVFRDPTSKLCSKRNP
uniref:Reverse transcriptase domain-containing protein n=1 Tax=Tanacetum cinerariifolium TaxID=118510 RepID=A0A699H9H2_TANCI|nr:reverse transcriptase domain-containing protein [Tanacetum cinerariifolium]